MKIELDFHRFKDGCPKEDKRIVALVDVKNVPNGDCGIRDMFCMQIFNPGYHHLLSINGKPTMLGEFGWWAYTDSLDKLECK